MVCKDIRRVIIQTNLMRKGLMRKLGEGQPSHAYLLLREQMYPFSVVGFFGLQLGNCCDQSQLMKPTTLAASFSALTYIIGAANLTARKEPFVQASFLWFLIPRNVILFRPEAESEVCQPAKLYSSTLVTPLTQDELERKWPREQGKKRGFTRQGSMEQRDTLD
uniref:Uncharacterized protein n=1 Tax=Micrurus paraensis TaxID=1970185 RepID=A0A2D4L0B8_9SAUR